MQIKDFFLNTPVFRYEEFNFFMKNKNKKMTQYNINRMLHYHIKAGNIVHIRKNLYGTILNNNWIDPYLIAAKATKNAVLGYLTALEIYGFAYTTFNELVYLSHRAAPAFEFQNQSFRATLEPKNLIKNKKEMMFVDEIQRDSITIKVTSLERTIVDILDRPNLAGGFEEIFRSFERIISFDAEKIVSYALALNKGSTIAKIGYFLSSQPEYSKVDNSILNKLKPYIPKSPHYMDKTKKSKFYSEWNLLVPLEIIEKKWEEPNEDYI